MLRGQARLSPAELLPAFRSGAPLVVFKSPLTSRVRRSARYDCVTVTAGGPGEGQTLHVFLGLLASADDGVVGRVPVVRRRIAEILLRAGVRRDSHTGRQLIAALRTLPRDELLEAPTADLLRLSQMIVERANTNRVGVFARTHLNRDFVSVLVYFAAERFGPDVRSRVSDTISRYWPGEIVAREDRFTDLGFVRMQFLIAQRPGVPQPVVERSRGRGAGRAGHPALDRRRRRRPHRRARRRRRRDSCCAATSSPRRTRRTSRRPPARRTCCASTGSTTATGWPSTSTPRPVTTPPTAG